VLSVTVVAYLVHPLGITWCNLYSDGSRQGPRLTKILKILHNPLRCKCACACSITDSIQREPGTEWFKHSCASVLLATCDPYSYLHKLDSTRVHVMRLQKSLARYGDSGTTAHSGILLRSKMTPMLSAVSILMQQGLSRQQTAWILRCSKPFRQHRWGQTAAWDRGRHLPWLHSDSDPNSELT
jgi:hypothetical protein